MANYAVEYVKGIDKFLAEEHSVDEVNDVLSKHLIKISFFQHERLVHLLVTILFAIMDIIMLAVCFCSFNFACFLLLFFFTVLLVPYIFHYYFLENSVQKMYMQYDEIRKRSDNF